MQKKFGTIPFYTRRPVERRRVEDKRLFLKQEDLDHNPERRVNMVGRRMTGDRRRMLAEFLKTFWKEDL